METLHIDINEKDLRNLRKHATVSVEILKRNPLVIYTPEELNDFWADLCTSEAYRKAGADGRARLNKLAATLRPYVASERCPIYEVLGILRPRR